jgi:hypothetical protein
MSHEGTRGAGDGEDAMSHEGTRGAGDGEDAMSHEGTRGAGDGVRVPCQRCGGIVKTRGGLTLGSTLTEAPAQCIGECSLEPLIRIPSERSVRERLALAEVKGRARSAGPGSRFVGRGHWKGEDRP